MRLHGRYHSPLSRALAQFTGALAQVGPVIDDIVVLRYFPKIKILLILCLNDSES